MEDDSNEIHNSDTEVEQKSGIIWMILTYTLLAAFLPLVIYMAYATIAGSGSAMNIGSNPRALIAPIVFVAAIAGLIVKSRYKKKTKHELLDFINSIDSDEIKISTIIEQYCADKESFKGMSEKYIKQEIKSRVIDLLWEGRLPGYKYVIDKKKLVRVKEDVNNQSE